MAVFMNVIANSAAKGVIRNSNSAKNIVDKIFTSRNTIQSSDLTGQTFSSVLKALKDYGVNDVKLVASKNCGYIVHAKNISRNTGLINLFPGGVMGPNGNLSVSFKFNSMGDCLQMTGLQKYANGSIGASTIRTNAGIANLQKHGVQNPTEYIQVAKTSNSKGIPYRHVSKTFSPFADKTSSENIVAKAEAEVAALNAKPNTTQSSTSEAREYVGGFKFGRVSAEERKYQRQYAQQQAMLNELRSYNSELADKVAKRLKNMREKDWDRADDFANDLVKRYSNGQNDLARFAKNDDNFTFLEDMFNKFN